MRQEKKRNHAESAQSRSEFAELLDIFPEPTILVDREGTILNASRAFTSRGQQEPQAFVGLNVYDLFNSLFLTDHLATLCREHVAEVIGTGKQLSFEAPESERYYRYTISPLRSEDGDVQKLLLMQQDITDHRNARRAAVREQALKQAFIDAVPGTFFLIDAQMKLAGWNSFLRDQVLCKAEEEVAGTDLLEYLHPDDRPMVMQKMLNVLHHGLAEEAEIRAARCKRSQTWWFYVTAKRIMLNRSPFLIGMGIEITQRKQAELELLKLNRTLQALSVCNRALLHAEDETELLREICRIVVEIGGYRMAWVGYAENNPEKSITPLAVVGDENGYLEKFRLSWADNEWGRGPAGTAIRTGQPCTTHDVSNDPRFNIWRSEAKARGYVSVFAIPLKSASEVFGTLVIYSSIPDAFHPEEQELLTSLADNLAYGMIMLQTRHAHALAEERLHHSEERYRSLFQNQHTVMLLIDPENLMIVDANPAAVHFYGWSQEELCRKKISEINLLGEDGVQSAIKLVCNEEQDYFIFRHSRADGSVRDVEVFIAPLTIDEKTMLYSVIHDITLRKRFESLALFRQRLLQMAASASEEELLRLSVDEAEKVTGSTIGFCHFLGEKSEADFLQVASTHVLEMMQGAPEFAAHPSLKNTRLWSEVERTKRAVIINHSNYDAPEAKMPNMHPEIKRSILVPFLHEERIIAVIWVGNKPLEYDDDDVKVVTTLANMAWDIVARKRAERSAEEMQTALNQSQKMELVGQLAGGIAHDFNNMLGVILGNAEMALEPQHAAQEPLQQNLKNILKAATRSADLTRQLLAFARKQTVIPVVLELNSVVEKMLSLLRRLIGEHVTIVWMPGSDRALVKMDPSQIEQILTNLCLNARDAIEDIGQLTIQTGRLCDKKKLGSLLHPCKITGDYVTLSITDNGCGIANEYIGHIFEPFFTTKEVGQGTGLGLSTVYGIVKQNSGCIDFQSVVGKGSTFKIHLPRYQEASREAAAQKQSRLAEKQGKATILLVENEPDILNLCKGALEGSGYTILSAGTPQEAIKLAQAHNGPIELLLTDVIMPEMNGSELHKELLKSNPHLKSLFMSGYSSEIIEQHKEVTHGFNFIQKPFSLKSLTMIVQKLLTPG